MIEKKIKCEFLKFWKVWYVICSTLFTVILLNEIQ